MKKLIVLSIALFNVNFIHCQEKFEISPSGITPFIVTQTENSNKEKEYTKTLEWINRSFQDPEEVILGKIENEYIRFQGKSKENVFCMFMLGTEVCDPIRYQIEISFKDNKYKMQILDIENYSSASSISHGGWWSIFAPNKMNLYFNNKGEVRKNRRTINKVAEYFNLINSNLKSYIENGISNDNRW